MVEKEDVMQQFLAKRDQEKYKLSLELILDCEKVLDYSIEIDAYEGEIGIRYASNLLFRLGNNAIMGLELEKIPWKEMDYSKNSRNFRYAKYLDSGETYIQITANQIV